MAGNKRQPLNESLTYFEKKKKRKKKKKKPFLLPFDFFFSPFLIFLFYSKFQFFCSK